MQTLTVMITGSLTLDWPASTGVLLTCTAAVRWILVVRVSDASLLEVEVTRILLLTADAMRVMADVLLVAAGREGIIGLIVGTPDGQR